LTRQLVTEEGLPIHEIREDFDGKLIGAAPQPTTSGEAVLEVSDDVDYWSEEAKARREALRRKIFSEDDSDLESSDEDQSSSIPVPEPNEETTSKPDVEPSTTSSRRSSASAPMPPRSILKAPARKKSVSFDASVPLPPDSPQSKAGKFGFPLPNSEFEPRPVPVIAEPRPAAKAEVTEMFSGFKPGFLTKSTPPADASGSTSTPGPKTKGPSRFAQSMAAQKQSQVAEVKPTKEAEPIAVKGEVMERQPPIVTARPSGGQPEPTSPAAVKGVVTERQTPMAGLPKFSETQPMGSMKNMVVEREPIKPVEADVQGDEADGDDEGNDDYDDEYDEDEDEEEEDDEYDLDEALLAREVALDYHRRQGYISKYTREVNSDGEEQEPIEYQVNSDGELEGTGAVLMGLPQISAEGQIINPTPDDIRKYVRVGRLENGNLVLAPGEEGWSSDEDAEKKAKRAAVKRQLLGLEPVPPPAPQPEPVASISATEATLPPKVVTESAPSSAASVDPSANPAMRSVGEVRERNVEAPPKEPESAPKKVSRFKAARMGL
jgi:CTD nuclear envelope phosphatase 1